MRWFRNLKTVSKLMLGFGLVGVILAGVGYMGVSSLGNVNGMLEILYGRDMVGLTAIKDAQVTLFTIARDMRQSLLVEKGNRPEIARGIDRLETTLRENLQKFEKSIATAEGRSKFADMEKAYAEYLPVMHEIVKLGVAGEDQAAKERLASAASTIRKVAGSFDDLAQTKQKLGAQMYQDGQRVYAAARTTMIGLIVVGILLGLALGYFIAMLIARALRQVVERSEQAAAGDLTVRVALDSRDELGQMSQALDRMLESFHDSMTQVQQAANSTSSASQQLAAGSEQLSSGAQEQASSLGETAASLEEMTSTVKQNAENAKQANQMAVGARGSAEQGGTVLREAVTAMEAITTSAKQIAAIITTIDEIAFQTNLLALNAAVEAARAGEQGRGFAVVASEVRALAQRAAASSKEIKALITDSVTKIEQGAKLVTKSGETLTEIVGGSKKVADLVAEISAASQEQAQGIEQVNKAVTQMDSVTQQNAAQTEELSSTAQSLSAQAEELSAQVAKFKLARHAVGQATVSKAAGKVIPLMAKAKTARPKVDPAKTMAGATGTDDAQGQFEEF